jgi:transposase
VLRLYFDLKLPQRQIARSIKLSQSTVSEYLDRFEKSGLGWPLPAGYDHQRLEEKLFGSHRSEPDQQRRPLPDFAHTQHELTTNRNTCLQLLWEEYREAHPDQAYSYSSFWRHFEEWRGRQDLVMRQQHRAGGKLFVDWAGAKTPIHDRETSEVKAASLFVAVLGASNYTYAEAALEEFDFGQAPKIQAARVRELAEGGYIDRSEPVVLIGECDPATFCTSLLHS